MTHATGHLAVTMIASMIAAAEEEGMVDATTEEAVITMIETVDTEEAVIATMTALASTATPEVVTTDTSDVAVVEATLTVTIAAETVAEIVVETVMVVAPARHHRQPNMVIQLLVQRLGNLMGSALLVKLHDPIAQQ